MLLTRLKGLQDPTFNSIEVDRDLSLAQDQLGFTICIMHVQASIMVYSEEHGSGWLANAWKQMFVPVQHILAVTPLDISPIIKHFHVLWLHPVERFV